MVVPLHARQRAPAYRLFRVLVAYSLQSKRAVQRFRDRMTMTHSAVLINSLLALCLIGQGSTVGAEDRYLAHSAQVESLGRVVELMVSDLAMARIAARQAERPEVREFADDVVRDLGVICATTQTALAKVSVVPLQLPASRMRLIEDWELSNARVDRAFLDAVVTDQAEISQALLAHTSNELPPQVHDKALRLAATTRECAHSLLSHSFEPACSNFSVDVLGDAQAEFVGGR
jgi:predicted outer membrane protein